MTETNRRILLIDDTPSIHEDFRKILTIGESTAEGALADAKELVSVLVELKLVRCNVR